MKSSIDYPAWVGKLKRQLNAAREEKEALRECADYWQGRAKESEEALNAYKLCYESMRRSLESADKSLSTQAHSMGEAIGLIERLVSERLEWLQNRSNG